MADIIYRAKYKCRLCGKVYDSSEETKSDGVIMLSILRMDGNSCKNIDVKTPKPFDIHHCENGNIGCAEFIGWQQRGVDNG